MTAVALAVAVAAVLMVGALSASGPDAVDLMAVLAGSLVLVAWRRTPLTALSSPSLACCSTRCGPILDHSPPFPSWSRSTPRSGPVIGRFRGCLQADRADRALRSASSKPPLVGDSTAHAGQSVLRGITITARALACSVRGMLSIVIARAKKPPALRRIVRAFAFTTSDRQRAAEEDACAYGTQLLNETREELNRADAKAQVLLGIVGIALGAVAGGLLAGSWSPFTMSNAIEWLWWAGTAAALASVGVLAGAVYPRLDRRKQSGFVMYYADVLRLESAGAVARTLMESSTRDLERTADQLHRVSRIVGQKYRLIRWGFWLLLSGMVATVSAVLINLLLAALFP
ncbi:Pycsar system effector family protein [Nonomuraea recticatena]